ncbi:DUF6083 domain-containing protein [Streptomyces sp. CRB46]|uniref:DUF6083 domain-containing protein n=1 Tax=Streptomyces sp. CRB46 TaxID=2682613 RepID=UPI001F2D0715|nr:DUF6083 domain-containing protein [Streptomyces sp. CRB46]
MEETQCKPDVRRAYTGRHVLLEPDGLIPAPLVPPGHRWRVDSDGIAWNPALDEPAPGTACRVPHLIACSGRGDPGGCADARHPAGPRQAGQAAQGGADRPADGAGQGPHARCVHRP